jgi:hypothetical protein
MGFNHSVNFHARAEATYWCTLQPQIQPGSKQLLSYWLPSSLGLGPSCLYGCAGDLGYTSWAHHTFQHLFRRFWANTKIQSAIMALATLPSSGFCTTEPMRCLHSMLWIHPAQRR